MDIVEDWKNCASKTIEGLVDKEKNDERCVQDSILCPYKVCLLRDLDNRYCNVKRLYNLSINGYKK